MCRRGKPIGKSRRSSGDFPVGELGEDLVRRSLMWCFPIIEGEDGSRGIINFTSGAREDLGLAAAQKSTIEPGKSGREPRQTGQALAPPVATISTEGALCQLSKSGQQRCRLHLKVAVGCFGQKDSFCTGDQEDPLSFPINYMYPAIPRRKGSLMLSGCGMGHNNGGWGV